VNFKKYLFSVILLFGFCESNYVHAKLPDNFFQHMKYARESMQVLSKELAVLATFNEPLEEESLDLRLLHIGLQVLVNTLDNIYKNRKEFSVPVPEIITGLESLNEFLIIQQQPLIAAFLNSAGGYATKAKWSQLEESIKLLKKELEEGLVIEQKEKQAEVQSVQLVEQQEQKKQLEQQKRQERREQVVTKIMPTQNIIILIDISEKFDPTIPVPNTPITQALGVALCQQIAPIVVSGHTIDQFIQMHKARKDVHLPGSEWENITEWLDNKWLLYAPHTTQGANSIYLLVPKSLSKESKLGLNLQSQPVEWKKFVLSSSSIFGREDIKSSQITYWFSPAKDVYWNIYLDGHGAIGQSDLEIPQLFSQRRYTDMLDVSKYQIYIAGLALLEFRNFLMELEKRSINLFVYISCFSGGYNLYLPFITPLMIQKNVLGSVQPHFTIVTASATDAAFVSTVPIKEICFKNQEEIEHGKLNFIRFFTLVNKYMLQPANYSEVELRELLTSILESPIELWNFLNMPQVKFPTSDRFVYLPMNPAEILVITESKAAAAAAEQKVIEIPYKTVTPKFIGLASVNIPTLQINIKPDDMPKILSMLPGISLHVIDKVEAKNINPRLFFMSFNLVEFIGKQTFMFPKYYFVKELVVNSEDDEQKSDLFKDWSHTKNNMITLLNVLIGFKAAPDPFGLDFEKVTVVALFSDNMGKTFLMHLPQWKAREYSKYKQAQNKAYVYSLEKNIDTKETPEEIVRQYLAFLDDKIIAQAAWWQEESFPTLYDTKSLFKPLEQLIGFKQQELKKEAATAQKIEQLTPKTRSENIAKAILSADVAFVQRLVQDPFDKTYQVIVQNIMVKPGKPVVYRAKPLPTDPSLLTFAKEVLQQQQKKITMAATTDQKQMIENLQKIISLLEQVGAKEQSLVKK
jgi:hypothetical protein